MIDFTYQNNEKIELITMMYDCRSYKGQVKLKAKNERCLNL